MNPIPQPLASKVQMKNLKGILFTLLMGSIALGTTQQSILYGLIPASQVVHGFGVFDTVADVFYLAVIAFVAMLAAANISTSRYMVVVLARVEPDRSPSALAPRAAIVVHRIRSSHAPLLPSIRRAIDTRLLYKSRLWTGDEPPPHLTTVRHRGTGCTVDCVVFATMHL